MEEIKRLVDCSWAEAVQAWNEGFRQYYVNVTMNVMQFTKRLAMPALYTKRAAVHIPKQQERVILFLSELGFETKHRQV